MLRTEGRSERRGERSRRKLSQGKPQSKSEVTYTKQQIHIVTNSKKTRDKKINKRHNLKVREGKISERQVRQM